MFRIDGHVHFPGNHPESLEILQKHDVLALNIVIGKVDAKRTRQVADLCMQLHQQNPGRFAWCTGFDPGNIRRKNYADDVIATLAKDVENGAVGCKIWKNIGMEIRDEDGTFVMPDDAAFEPLYTYMEQQGIPLLSHLAEPLACWQPLSVPSPHQGYYSRNPQWHMYGKPAFPSHQTILDARNRVIERHPGLTVIGAHLGSMEYDLDVVAACLDRYPNFAIDTSARTADLAMHDTSKVREFFHQYSDRIIYGSDVAQHDLFHGEADDAERRRRLDSYEKILQADIAYFESDQMVQVQGRSVQGLNLPADLLQNIYVNNALKWYPALQRSISAIEKPV